MVFLVTVDACNSEGQPIFLQEVVRKQVAYENI